MRCVCCTDEHAFFLFMKLKLVSFLFLSIVTYIKNITSIVSIRCISGIHWMALQIILNVMVPIVWQLNLQVKYFVLCNIFVEFTPIWSDYCPKSTNQNQGDVLFLHSHFRIKRGILSFRIKNKFDFWISEKHWNPITNTNRNPWNLRWL